MTGIRVQRVERELQQVIGSFLSHGLKEPLHGLVTVAGIEVSKDLRSAKVFLSQLGTEENKEANTLLVEKQRGQIQKHISKTLDMKFTPMLKFFFNHTVGEPSEVDLLLANLRKP